MKNTLDTQSLENKHKTPMHIGGIPVDRIGQSFWEGAIKAALVDFTVEWDADEQQYCLMIFDSTVPKDHDRAFIEARTFDASDFLDAFDYMRDYERPPHRAIKPELREQIATDALVAEAIKVISEYYPNNPNEQEASDQFRNTIAKALNVRLQDFFL